MSYDAVKYYPCTAQPEQAALQQMFTFDAGFFRWDMPTIVLSTLYLSNSPTWWELRLQTFIDKYQIERITIDIEGFPVDVLRIQGEQWWELYQALLAGTLYPGMPRCSIVNGFGHPA